MASNNNIMKYTLQAEGAAYFILAIVLLNHLPVHFSWWAWILLFLAPDISMIGYALNDKAGALLYNLFHHHLVAVAVCGSGVLLHQPYVALTGLILLGHSGMDRMLGYGLKKTDGFKHTYL